MTSSAQRTKEAYSPNRTALGEDESEGIYSPGSMKHNALIAQLGTCKSEDLRNNASVLPVMKLIKDMSNTRTNTVTNRREVASKVMAAMKLANMKVPAMLVETYLKAGPPSDEWIDTNMSETKTATTRSRAAAPKTVDGVEPAQSEDSDTNAQKLLLALGQISQALSTVTKFVVQSNPSLLHRMEQLETQVTDPDNAHIFGNPDGMYRSTSLGYYLLHFLGGCNADKATHFMEMHAKIGKCAEILKTCEAIKAEQILSRMSQIMHAGEKSDSPELTQIGFNYAMNAIEENLHLNANNVLSSKIVICQAHDPTFSMYELQQVVNAEVAKIASKSNIAALNSGHRKQSRESGDATQKLTLQVAQLEEQLARATGDSGGRRPGKFDRSPPSDEKRKEMSQTQCKRGENCAHHKKGTCWFKHDTDNKVSKISTSDLSGGNGLSINSVSFSTELNDDLELEQLELSENATSDFGNCIIGDFYDSDESN